MSKTQTADIVDQTGKVAYRLKWTPGSQYCGVAPAANLRDFRCMGALDVSLMVSDDIAKGFRWMERTQPSETVLDLLFGNGMAEALANA